MIIRGILVDTYNNKIEVHELDYNEPNYSSIINNLLKCLMT